MLHFMRSLGSFISSLQLSSTDGNHRVLRLSMNERPSGLRLTLRWKIGFGNKPECVVYLLRSSLRFRNAIFYNIAANLPLASLQLLCVFVHVDAQVLAQAFGKLR
ncbi:hypothetical protein CPB83DRAFT_179959 [Crepidotus variabilis]|uniref:Uncharacterized protein n=1 Tax=Crepidotus variabilis TaxID=179855 RepID=A0A9P6EK94_9AGAR|nr:hypothetical protein CPB83DRAFT_179959 [Crepidotus variabilis]